VLEIGDPAYTRQFGGGRVTHSDVLHVTAGNPQATIVADLTQADHLPADAFDCLLVPQTLHLIYDMRAALSTMARILRPGGVLLLTVPGISPISRDAWGDSWHWSLTRHSAARLFGEAFPHGEVHIHTYGNVLAATAFLQGLARQELAMAELDAHDPCYPVTVGVRAVKRRADG